jgi:hypothetical protein
MNSLMCVLQDTSPNACGSDLGAEKHKYVSKKHITRRPTATLAPANKASAAQRRHCINSRAAHTRDPKAAQTHTKSLSGAPPEKGHRICGAKYKVAPLCPHEALSRLLVIATLKPKADLAVNDIKHAPLQSRCTPEAAPHSAAKCKRSAASLQSRP